jgi:pimeloyl-ACP methyl ester carboxylesterase
MDKVRSADGTEIAYDRVGEGPTVVLVSGATADRQSHAQLAAALAANFTVLNYDRRGRGDSTDSADTAKDAVRREVEDIEALIGVTGGPAHIAGSSSGGILAFEAAAAGLPITKVAMWEPPYAVGEDAVEAFQRYKADIKDLIEQGRRGDTAARFLQFVGLPDEMVAGMRHSPMWPGMERVAPTLFYDAEAIGDGPVPAERIASLAADVLVLEGRVCWPGLHASAEALATVPGVRHQVIDGQDHQFSDEAMAAALTEFYSN